jgi:hypothetical protein
MKTSNLLRAAGVIVLVLLVALLVYNVAVERPAPATGPVVRAPAAEPSASLLKTDANGDAWMLDRAGGGPLLSAGLDAPKAGPPILVRADVSRTGANASIGLTLEGRAGEQYRPVVKKNGTTLSAPTLRIVNEAGQVITEGSFQYG